MTTDIHTEKQQSDPVDGTERARSSAVYRPAVDIVETGESVILVADLPGVDESSTDISVEKNVLTISGRVDVPQFEGYTLAYSEYGIGDFERSFTLSNEIDRDRIEATVKDGVLQVVLPKSKQTAKKVKVEART